MLIHKLLDFFEFLHLLNPFRLVICNCVPSSLKRYLILFIKNFLSEFPRYFFAFSEHLFFIFAFVYYSEEFFVIFQDNFEHLVNPFFSSCFGNLFYRNYIIVGIKINFIVICGIRINFKVIFGIMNFYYRIITNAL